MNCNFVVAWQSTKKNLATVLLMLVLNIIVTSKGILVFSALSVSHHKRFELCPKFCVCFLVLFDGSPWQSSYPSPVVPKLSLYESN